MRLIDADDLAYKIQISPDNASKFYYLELISEKYSPTVEAVQTDVIYCKDCKHYSNEADGWCYKHSHAIGYVEHYSDGCLMDEWTMFDPDDFCSWGERRNDDGTK